MRGNTLAGLHWGVRIELCYRTLGPYKLRGDTPAANPQPGKEVC